MSRPNEFGFSGQQADERAKAAGTLGTAEAVTNGEPVPAIEVGADCNIGHSPLSIFGCLNNVGLFGAILYIDISTFLSYIWYLAYNRLRHPLTA